MQSGDRFMIFLILLVLGTWLFMYVRGRMKATVEEGFLPLPLPLEEEVPEDEATLFLEELGFTVIQGKKRIPVEISTDTGIMLQSRIFIDYFVERDGLYYSAIIAKDRKPMEMTGSSVRDRLLVYQLLYPQTKGVLYLDIKQRKASVITFELDMEA